MAVSWDLVEESVAFKNVSLVFRSSDRKKADSCTKVLFCLGTYSALQNGEHIKEYIEKAGNMTHGTPLHRK